MPRLCKHLDLRVTGVPAKILHVRKINAVYPLVGEKGIVLQEGNEADVKKIIKEEEDFNNVKNSKEFKKLVY